MAHLPADYVENSGELAAKKHVEMARNMAAESVSKLVSPSLSESL